MLKGRRIRGANPWSVSRNFGVLGGGSLFGTQAERGGKWAVHRTPEQLGTVNREVSRRLGKEKDGWKKKSAEATLLRKSTR